MVDAMTDVARMEDDGGCIPQGIGLHIGIPPMPAPAHEGAGSKLDPEGGPPDSAAPVTADTPEDDKLTWAKYSAWRKTKCPARGDDERLSEINQATLELVGEIAEVGALIQTSGLESFRLSRQDLIDEAGDVIFCAAWAISAWGHEDRLAILDLELDGYFGATQADVRLVGSILQKAPDATLGALMGVISDASEIISAALAQASSAGGLTANALKKILYQKREQDSAEQARRIFYVIGALRQLLCLAGSDVETAMRLNMQKLDARFPNG